MRTRKRGEVLNATLWGSIKVLALVNPLFRSACIGRGIKDRAQHTSERTTKSHVTLSDFKQVRFVNSGWTEVQLSGEK